MSIETPRPNAAPRPLPARSASRHVGSTPRTTTTLDPEALPTIFFDRTSVAPSEVAMLRAVLNDRTPALATAPETTGAVLFVPDSAGVCDCLTRSLTSMGNLVSVVAQPLDFIERLQDQESPVGAVFAPLGDASVDALSVLAFVKSAFPEVRRVAYLVDVHEDVDTDRAGRSLRLLPNRWSPTVERLVRFEHRHTAAAGVPQHSSEVSSC
jgi:hypothetical protein